MCMRILCYGTLVQALLPFVDARPLGPSLARPLASKVAAATARPCAKAHPHFPPEGTGCKARPAWAPEARPPQLRFLPCSPPHLLNPHIPLSRPPHPSATRVRRHHPRASPPAPPAASPATPPPAHPWYTSPPLPCPLSRYGKEEAKLSKGCAADGAGGRARVGVACPGGWGVVWGGDITVGAWTWATLPRLGRKIPQYAPQLRKNRQLWVVRYMMLCIF